MGTMDSPRNATANSSQDESRGEANSFQDESSMTRARGRRWTSLASLVPMGRVQGERRHADRDVLRALRAGCAVAHPLAPARGHRLAGADLEAAAFEFHVEGPREHDGVLVEIRPLAGLVQPEGDRMWATLTFSVFVRTRPTNSSMRLGGCAGGGDPVGGVDEDGHARKLTFAASR